MDFECNKRAEFVIYDCGTGVGVEKPNNWAFDTTQFDSILKRLKVVCYVLVWLFEIFYFFASNLI